MAFIEGWRREGAVSVDVDRRFLFLAVQELHVFERLAEALRVGDGQALTRRDLALVDAEALREELFQTELVGLHLGLWRRRRLRRRAFGARCGRRRRDGL